MRSDTSNSSSGKYGQSPEIYQYQAKTANFTASPGVCYLVTKLDGCAVTLPAPNVGDKIKIVLGAVTSNTHSITCDATTTLFEGYALMWDADDATAAQHVVFAPDGSDDDAFSMNGTTTGISAVIELVGVQNNTAGTGAAAGRWHMAAQVACSGAVATPFA